METPDMRNIRSVVFGERSAAALAEALHIWTITFKNPRIIAMTQSESSNTGTVHITLTILFWEG